MEKVEFYEWISRKYTKWRGETIGREGTVANFAKEIGVGRSLVTQWMKKGGKVPDSYKAITGLVALFGDEVYGIIGLEKPKSPPSILDKLPSAFRAQLEAAISESNNAAATKRIVDKDSPEALEIALKAFEEHGIKLSIPTK